MNLETREGAFIKMSRCWGCLEHYAISYTTEENVSLDDRYGIINTSIIQFEFQFFYFFFSYKLLHMVLDSVPFPR